MKTPFRYLVLLKILTLLVALAVYLCGQKVFSDTAPQKSAGARTY